MSRAMRTAIALLAVLVPWPVFAQMLGPTWETGIVLTKSDFDMMRVALDQGLHGKAVGTVAPWTNPGTGHFGTLQLERHFIRSGHACERLDYTIAAGPNGARIEHYVFDVCRQPDGSWKFA